MCVKSNGIFCKKITVIAVTISLFGLLDLSKAHAEVSNQNSLDKELSSESVQSEVKTSWIQDNTKDNKDQKLELKSKVESKTVPKGDIETKFIHNNGNPIDTNVIEEPGNNHLYAIYQTELDGKLYEKYYFTDVDGNNVLNNEELSEMKKDALENTKEIKNGSENFINQLERDNTSESSKSSSNSLSTMAVASQPKGGYYKTYSFKFYQPITHLQAGTYTSTVHLLRKSSSANINGKTGSVWDIDSFNEYESKHFKINQLTTRNDVNYGAEKLVSYGPFDDAGYNVSVNLSGIVPSNPWSFSVGSVITNNVSSTANKYGRWIWTHTSDYMQNPFVTKPGLRVTNTSGSFAIKTSHSLHVSYGSTHGTGVITTTVPDR